MVNTLHDPWAAGDDPCDPGPQGGVAQRRQEGVKVVVVVVVGGGRESALKGIAGAGRHVSSAQKLPPEAEHRPSVAQPLPTGLARQARRWISYLRARASDGAMTGSRASPLLPFSPAPPSG